MPDDQPITDGQPQGHRAGAWVVLLMGIAGLGLGVYQWHGSFAAAFAKTGSAFKTPDQVEAERIAAMKDKDTDEDGLTDYDETYIYKTSPYLKDSDSDGKDDKSEVEKGTDPNCPTESCGNVLGSAGAAGASASESGTATAAGDSAQLQQDVEQQIMNPTPEQVRALLIQSGAKAEDLQGIDDATLLDLYRQSLQEVQAQQAQTPSP